MAVEKFEHLKKVDVTPENILKTPVEEVSNDHLFQLGEHFKGIKEKHPLDTDVLLAADEILGKIDKIVNLGKNKKSLEIMRAADDYNDELAA